MKTTINPPNSNFFTGTSIDKNSRMAWVPQRLSVRDSSYKISSAAVGRFSKPWHSISFLRKIVVVVSCNITNMA